MKSKSSRHPYKILTFQDRKVRIDTDIAPLLSAMWQAGIRTAGSCQAQCSFRCKCVYKLTTYKTVYNYYKRIKTPNCSNNIWIVFYSAKDIEKFYNIVYQYTPDYKDDITAEWATHCHMDNEGIEYVVKKTTSVDKTNGAKWSCMSFVDQGCKKNKFNLQPQLTIPRKHLAYLESKFKVKK